jgi:hypothetical protein
MKVAKICGLFMWNNASAHIDDNPVNVLAEVFGEQVISHGLLPP